MDRVHRLELAVGALLLLGLLGTIFLVLTADKVKVQRSYQLTAWMQDAGGLRFESPVTLAGIQVGKVVDIRAAEDRTRGSVMATLKINQDVVVPEDVLARMVSSGVFGDSFLALAPAEKPNGRQLSSDGSGSFSVQPGFFDEAASQVRGILSGVHELLDPENRATAKRLLNSTADLAQTAAHVAKRLETDQERMGQILDELQSASHTLRTFGETTAQRSEAILGRVDRLLTLAEDRLPGTLSRADATLVAAGDAARRVDALLALNSPRIAAATEAIAEAARQAGTVLAALAQGQGVLGQLLVNRELARDLHAVTVDLGSAAQQIADKPSRLVFDDSAAQQNAEHLRRDRAKMRHTLDEGLASHSSLTASASVTASASQATP